MSFILCIAVICAIGTTVFTPSTAAPTISHALRGLIQENSPPDSSIGNWFTNTFNLIAEKISKGLADKDPEKIEKVREYVKKYRHIIEPVASFIEKNYPNDKTASNIIGAINTFLSTLDNIVDGSVASQQTFDRDMQNMAKLMMILEAATS